jgi:integrase
MTVIKVKGFKIFQDKKPPFSWRCYHRKTGHKIDLDRAPVGSAAFLAECVKINALAKALEAKGPKAGTLGGLIASYYAEQHFLNLSARTRSDYRKVAGYLDRVLDTPAHVLDTPLVAGIHAKALAKIGWRQANILRTLLVEVFRYAIPKGLISINPALAVIPHPRPKDRARANRPWEIAELEAVLTTAKPHVAAVVALIANTGLDPSDALHLRRDALKDGVLWAWRGKTGEAVALPVGRRLQAALTAASGHDAITILATSKGRPWTYNGFSTVWHRFKQKQVEAGRLPSDLTLKGLRHMVATILRESGATPREIADLLGQKTEAMALHYSRDASLANRNRATTETLDAEAEKRTEVVKLSEKSVKLN